MYGWGWSYRDGKRAEVPPPFTFEAVVTETDGFKTATGRSDQNSHPLASMWLFLSPIRAGNTWQYSHICVFNERPSIPEDADKLSVLGKVIAAADVTGFAHVFVDTAQS
jgi:hypothetical protein